VIDAPPFLSLVARDRQAVRVAERVHVREIDDDEGRRLLRTVRRGTGSVVTWRAALSHHAHPRSRPAAAEERSRCPYGHLLHPPSTGQHGKKTLSVWQIAPMTSGPGR
jgi:hypothetical protein